MQKLFLWSLRLQLFAKKNATGNLAHEKKKTAMRFDVSSRTKEFDETATVQMPAN